MPFGLLGGVARGLLRGLGGFLKLAGLSAAATYAIDWIRDRRQERERRRQQASRQYQQAFRRNPLREALRLSRGQPPSIPENPLYNTASEVANWPRRLEAAGVQAPQPEQIPQRRNLLERVLEPVIRPGRAVSTYYGELLRTGSLQQAARRANEAWDDPSQALWGQDVLGILGQRSQLARRLHQNPVTRFLTGFAWDVATDPFNRFSIVTRPVGSAARAAAGAIQVSQQPARRILMVQPGRLVRTRIRDGRALSEAQRAQRAMRRRYFIEVTEEGGRRRIRRLAPSELPENFITGRQETQVRDRVADMLVDRRLQRLERQGFRSLPVRLRQAIESQAQREATRRITEIIPQYRPTAPQMRTMLRVMGRDVVDLTPVRTALGAVIQRLPGMTRLQDAVGRTFSLTYIPTSLPAGERAAVRAAFQTILQETRRTGAQQSEIIRNVARQWRRQGLPPEVAQRVPALIERTLRSTDPTDQRAVEIVQRFFKEQLQRLHELGVPVRVLANYVPHIYEGRPRVVQQALENLQGMLEDPARQAGQQLGRQLGRLQPSFLRRRLIETLEEAERKHGLKPVKDARVLMGVYGAMVRQIEGLRTISRQLSQMAGVVSDRPLPGWRPVTASRNLGEILPELRGKWIHPEVDRMLNNVVPLLINRDDAIEGLMRHVNTVAGILKTLWLPVDIVRFNLNQLVGNVTLNIADGMFDPRRYYQAALILTERGRRLLPTVRLAGREIPTEEIYRWFREAGLEGTGRVSSFRTQGSLVAEARRAVAREDMGLRYFTTLPGLERAAWSVPEAIDNLSRMANFLHHLASGKSIQDAADATRRALGDYSMMTLFERRAIRPFIWFYPWLRFSVPRVIERIIGAPGLLTGWAHLQSNAIRLTEDQFRQLGFGEIDVEQLLPEWAREQGAIPLWVDAQGNLHYILSDVPLAELAQLPDPSPADVIRWIGLQSPPFTLVAPWVTGVDPLTQQPITDAPDVPEEARRDRQLYLLRQLGPLGRLVSQGLGLDEESQELQAAQTVMQQGEVPFIDPALRPRNADILNPVRTIHPSYAQAAQLMRARNYYRQLAQAAENRGIVIPETEEVRQGDTLGNPLRAALTEARIRRGELPPSAGQEAGNPLRQALVASRVQRAGDNVPGFIYEAMRLTGVDESWAPFLNYLMRTSSGGQVTMVGPVTPDGERLIGAFQMPPSIFQRYAAPGMTNIFNPLHNAVAFIRFVQDRYGHPSRMPELAGR